MTYVNTLIISVISTIIIMASVVTTSVSAQSNTTTNGNDCGLVRNYDGKNSILSYPAVFDTLYSKENIQVALKNLKGYCCAYNTNDTQLYCDTAASREYADSALLVEHLVDVGMRALDGNPKTAYAGMTLDLLGQHRRELIDYSQTASADELISTQKDPLSTIYSNIRGLGQPSFLYGEDMKIPVDTHCDRPQRDTLATQWNEAKTNTPAQGLLQRYQAMCQMLPCLAQTDKNEAVQKVDRVVNSCLALVSKRITAEEEYVRLALVDRTARLLQHNFSTYTKDYFSKTRLDTLYNKFTDFQANFAQVNNRIQEGTRQCSGG